MCIVKINVPYFHSMLWTCEGDSCLTLFFWSPSPIAASSIKMGSHIESWPARSLCFILAYRVSSLPTTFPTSHCKQIEVEQSHIKLVGRGLICAFRYSKHVPSENRFEYMHILKDNRPVLLWIKHLIGEIYTFIFPLHAFLWYSKHSIGLFSSLQSTLFCNKTNYMFMQWCPFAYILGATVAG